MMEERENENNEIGESRDFTSPRSASVALRMPVRKQLFVLVGVLGIMFVVGGASVYFKSDRQNEPTDQIVTPGDVAVEQNNDDTKAATFSNISLQAKSAFVIDAKSGQVLFEKEPDLDWPLASITKLMTALVAKELVAEGDIVPITAAAMEQSGDSHFSLGERFSYKKLSDLTLLMSSNDGAYALAAAAGATLDEGAPESAFVKAMNVRAKELGLGDTTFRNPTGLDISESEAGAYGTARDVASLMSYILKNYPELLEETTNTSALIRSEDGGAHDANNTNRVVGEIATVIGSKTGYTTLAGGNLVMAFDAGLDHPVVAVVMGSSYQGRFSDMVKLVEAAKNEISSQNESR